MSQKLEEYYASRQWKDDYAMDEAGEFSGNLKRGVLSEDGIYNVLKRNKELLERMEGKTSGISGKMRKVVTVNPSVFYETDGLEFDTVPAYNTIKPFHMKSAGWVGYILRIDRKRVYIAGDTDATKEAKAVRCNIALVPIGEEPVKVEIKLDV